ncbi:hypothetical protein RI367_004222 [Sorochytrium milnesiophthora]
MHPTALVLVADGSEEMEAVITIDVLRRAEFHVTVAGLASAGAVKCSRDVKVVPDVSLAEVKDKQFNVVVLPGGLGGAKAFKDSTDVQQLLRRQASASTSGGSHCALICAAPIILPVINIFPGATVTSHPSVRDQVLQSPATYKYSEERVVVAGTSDANRLITSRGPGTAFEFALKLVEVVCGSDRVTKVSEPMLLEI